jgi:GTPase SAR1 family protein
MNILMLGHASVGKTTYMASMYGVMQTPIKGFTVRSSDVDDHYRLLELYRKILIGRYPASTNQRESYRFRLLHAGDEVLDFNWTDYRGDSLNYSTRDDSGQSDAAALHKDLKEADAILAFFDSTALISGHGSFPQIRRMLQLLNTAMGEIDRKVPLGLVLAKSDLIYAPLSEVIDPLWGLIESVQASKHVIGSIFPISCGEEIQDVELPALFALYLGIVSRSNQLVEAINKMADERDKMREKVSNFWDMLVDTVESKWNSQPTWNELADRKQKEVLREYNALKSLEKPAEELEEYLKNTVGISTF